MPESSDTAGGAPAQDFRLTKGIRLSALAALFLYLYAVDWVYDTVFATQWPDGPEYFRLFLLYFAPLPVCYAAILWLVPSGGGERGIQLARVVGTGVLIASFGILCPAAIVALVGMFSNLGDEPPDVARAVLFGSGVVAFWCWAHLLLRRLAGTALMRMESFQGRSLNRRLMAWIGAGLGTYLAAMLVVYVGFYPGTIVGREPPEASSVGSLRTIHTASEEYRLEYGAGYPQSLAVLGTGGEPSCSKAGLIDPVLAAGTKSGYQFTYIPFGKPIESKETGCPPGFERYMVLARPVAFGRSGRYSFCLDDTGTIRYTKNDRSATPSDPTLQ